MRRRVFLTGGLFYADARGGRRRTRSGCASQRMGRLLRPGRPARAHAAHRSSDRQAHHHLDDIIIIIIDVLGLPKNQQHRRARGGHTRAHAARHRPERVAVCVAPRPPARAVPFPHLQADVVDGADAARDGARPRGRDPDAGAGRQTVYGAERCAAELPLLWLPRARHRRRQPELRLRDATPSGQHALCGGRFDLLVDCESLVDVYYDGCPRAHRRLRQTLARLHAGGGRGRDPREPAAARERRRAVPGAGALRSAVGPCARRRQRKRRERARVGVGRHRDVGHHL